MRKPSQNVKKRIYQRVEEKSAAMWTPSDFLDLGTRDAVDKALQRLVKTGQLRRVDRGLYDRSAINTLTKKPTSPDYRKIIQVIARRDGKRMMPDGMTAANDLGLTDAIPGKIVVYTDARTKPVRVGNLRINFKPSAAKKLYWADRPAMRVVQALHWLKDTLPTDRDRIMKRLLAVLSDPATGTAIEKDLRDGLRLLPIWMQRIVRDLLKAAKQSRTEVK